MHWWLVRSYNIIKIIGIGAQQVGPTYNVIKMIGIGYNIIQIIGIDAQQAAVDVTQRSSYYTSQSSCFSDTISVMV